MKKISSFFISINKKSKNEILKNSLVLLVVLASTLFFTIYYKSLLFLLIGLCLLMVYPLIAYFYYSSIKEKIREELLADFINVFGYLKMYLETGSNVYNSLLHIKNYANKDLSKLIENLIFEIDVDKSINPFINFAKNFNNAMVDQVIINLYHLIDSTNYNDDFKYFDFTFDRLLEENDKLIHEKRKNSLNGKTAFALIGSAVFILGIIVAVISVMGEMINGF